MLSTFGAASSRAFGLGTSLPASGPDLGLSPSLATITGQTSFNAWGFHSVDTSLYAGSTVELVWRYVNGASGTSYRGDFQIDYIRLMSGGTTTTYYSFEFSLESFKTTTSITNNNFSTLSFSNLGSGTSSYRWNRDSGGTPSSSTGSTNAAAGNYYVYAETSGSNTNSGKYWLKSPQVTLPSGNTSVSFYTSRYGSNIGSLDFYINVIS